MRAVGSVGPRAVWAVQATKGLNKVLILFCTRAARRLLQHLVVLRGRGGRGLRGLGLLCGSHQPGNAVLLDGELQQVVLLLGLAAGALVGGQREGSLVKGRRVGLSIKYKSCSILCACTYRERNMCIKMCLKR